MGRNGRLALAAAAIGLLTAAAEPGEAPAAADPPPDLKACAAIADGAERLACYDALAGRPADGPAPAVANFGLPRASVAPEEADSITAHIVGSFTEWRSGTVVRLDNGQRWKVTEDGRVYGAKVPDNAEVTISRGTFAYWMEIHAIERKVKVKRLS